MQMQDWKTITKNSYDTYATDYASFASKHYGKLGEWTEEFSSSFKKGSKILDIGCGHGRDAALFASKGLEVTGIDYSESLLKLARRAAPNARFVLMDFEDLSFPEETFDGAIASASLYHIPKKNLPAVIKKVYGVLKKGGLFFAVIREGNEEKFTEEQRGDAIMKRFGAYYSEKELRSIFEGAGFKNIKQEQDPIMTSNWIGIWATK